MTLATLRAALPAALLAAAVAVAGCATLQHKERASRLRDELFSYSKLVRWSEFAAARRSVRPREGTERTAAAGPAVPVRVTHYRVVHTDFNDDATEATVTSSLRFVHGDSGREVGATDRQIWWWSHDEGRWFLDGDVPDFAAALRAPR